MYYFLLFVLGIQQCFAGEPIAAVPIAAPIAVPIAAPEPVAIAEDPCVLPKVVGPCRAAFPRFFFNKDSNKCEQFTYGGCQGNSNNFETIEACQQKCQKPVVVENPCVLPKVVGPCKAAFRRFFFNANSNKCEQFIYGGCQGNSNNFETIEACQQKCQKAVDVCKLPSETGLCRAYFERYFFNSNTNKCEIFVYGGCGGNGNNFETEAACKEKCDSLTARILAKFPQFADLFNFADSDSDSITNSDTKINKYNV